MNFAHSRRGQSKPVGARGQEVGVAQLVTSANVELRNGLPDASRRSPSADVESVDPGGGWDVAEPVPDQLVPAEVVLVVDLSNKINNA